MKFIITSHRNPPKNYSLRNSVARREPRRQKKPRGYEKCWQELFRNIGVVCIGNNDTEVWYLNTRKKKVRRSCEVRGISYRVCLELSMVKTLEKSQSTAGCSRISVVFCPKEYPLSMVTICEDDLARARPFELVIQTHDRNLQFFVVCNPP
jgi:hypothetical protein